MALYVILVDCLDNCGPAEMLSTNYELDPETDTLLQQVHGIERLRNIRGSYRVFFDKRVNMEKWLTLATLKYNLS